MGSIILPIITVQTIMVGPRGPEQRPGLNFAPPVDTGTTPAEIIIPENPMRLEYGEELTDKVIIVAGAGDRRGLGKRIVEYANASGAKVLFVSTGRSQDDATALATAQKEKGYDAEWMEADLTDPSQAQTVVQKAVSLYGRVDSLIHCVGATFDGPFVRLPQEDWEQGFRVNGLSAVYMARAVINQALRQDRGKEKRSGAKLLFLASISREGMGGQSIYSFMKAGLVGFAGALSKEYWDRGILVNALAPGLVPGTRMTERLTKEQQQAILRMCHREKPVAREEVAEAAMFFMSSRSSDTTGQTVLVLGGENYYERDVRPTFDYFAQIPEYDRMNTKKIRDFLLGVKPGERILDMACASGRNTLKVIEYLKTFGIDAEVTGIDINADDLVIAVQLVPDANFIHADATNLRGIPSEYFSRALFFNAWHEIQGKSKRVVNGTEQEVENKDLALQELFRVLQPGAQAMFISGFTRGVFTFPSITDQKERTRRSRQEWIRHDEIRKATFAELGEQKAEGVAAFEVLGEDQVIEKLTSAGFVDIKVENIEINLDLEAMRRIGDDEKWYDGMLQDMTNRERHGFQEARRAYNAVLDRIEAEHNRLHPGEPLLFSRVFKVFTVRKPEAPQILERTPGRWIS